MTDTGCGDEQSQLERLKAENQELRRQRAEQLREENALLHQMVASEAKSQSLGGTPSPSTEEELPVAGTQVSRGLISFAGRLNRVTFLVGSLCASVAMLALAVILMMAFAASYSDQYSHSRESSPAGYVVIGALLGLPVLVFGLSNQVRRLHDLGFSGFLVLAIAAFAIVGDLLLIHRSSDRGAFSALVQLCLILWLACAPGRRCSNRFGPAPGPGVRFKHTR